MGKIQVIIILASICTSVYAQNDSLRNETHIFWSKKYQIKIEDFEDTIKSTRNLEYCKKYNFCWGAYTGLFSVLDIPKKRKDRKGMKEVIYFAPAFEVKNSYRLTTDSMDYLKQVLIFDMYELAARKCRMELDSIYNMAPSIGIMAIFFKSIETDVQENLGKMVKAYTQEVYIQKLEGAFEKWREIISELLEHTIQFQTTSIDRMRFIKKEPLIKGYIRAPKVIGNLIDE